MSDETTASAPDALAQKVRRGRPPRVRTESSEPKREPQGRAERIPLGVQQDKLKASQRQGYVRRWINDNGSRVANAKAGGWEFVREDSQASSTDMGQGISRIVGTKEGGQPLNAFLMEIRKDWYDADQQEKQKAISATDDLIRRGELNGKAGDDGRYVPRDRIKFTRV